MNWLLDFEGILREFLIDLISTMLTELFSLTADRYNDFASMIGETPQSWNPGIFSTVQSLSTSVMVPVANVILTLVASLELFHMLIDRNNMNDMEPALILKWIFKTTVASLCASNAWTITMAVFDVAGSIAANASGIVGGSITGIDASAIAAFVATLDAEPLGHLVLILLQTVLSWAILFLITIGILILLLVRMVEIYITISVSPIPFAAMFGREWTGGMGANYLRSLFALGFQGFFIIVCLSIYTTMMQNVVGSTDIIMAMWKYIAYSGVLLFAVRKTDSISKSVFASH